jgi:acetoin utilization deacetylase AcuC-like enzyme
MVSTFRHSFHPYSGVSGRSERMILISLEAHSGSKELRHAVEQSWMPAPDTFRAQMIFIPASFDAHIRAMGGT